jgi:glutamate-1-semialdehyde aminotransferase
MEAFNPKVGPERCIRHTGTWNANPLACASGIAACKMHLNGEPQRKAAEIGAYLRQKGTSILKKRNISGRLYGRTTIHFYFGPLDYEPSDETLPPTLDVRKHMNPTMIPIKSRLCLHLLQRGVATLGGRFFIMMSVHTKEDVDQTMDVLDDALSAMIEEGTVSKDLLLS